MGKKRIECAYVKSDITVAPGMSWNQRCFAGVVCMKIDEHGNYTDYTATVPSCGNFHQEYDDLSVDLGRFPMVFRRKTPNWNGQDLPYFASKVQLLGSMAGRMQLHSMHSNCSNSSDFS